MACSTFTDSVFDLEKVTETVKKQIFGQDEHIDTILSFIHAAITRSLLIRESAEAEQMLPLLNSMLIVGPTASGKTHTIKTIAHTLGLPLHTIDAGSLTGEGWKGNSVSTEWALIANTQKNNPTDTVLVFVDEIDKLTLSDKENPSFSPQFDFLKALAGGIITGEGNVDGLKARYELDCNRCIFIFSGAFTGIEKIISNRISSNLKSFAGKYNSALRFQQMPNEDLLRNQISLEDIESWGFPREFVGRFSLVDFMPALSEETLKRILIDNLVPRYNNLMLGGSFSVDTEAVNKIVQKALSENYGARSLNQQLSELFLGECWSKIASSKYALDIRIFLTRENEIAIELAPLLSQKHSLVSFKKSNLNKATIKEAQETLSRIKKIAEDISSLKTANPFKTIDNDFIFYAACILNKTKERAGDYSYAEILLLLSLLYCIHDWFPKSDFNPNGLTTLLGMSSTNKEPDYESKLDLLFKEIQTGKCITYNPIEQKSYSSNEKSFSLQASLMIRHAKEDPKEGICCGSIGGLKPNEDSSLKYYTCFKTLPIKEQDDAIKNLSYRFISRKD